MITIVANKWTGDLEGASVTACFFRDPPETALGLENDLIYGVSKKFYLEAIGWGYAVADSSKMLELRKRGSTAIIEPIS
jgi:hypothetical protein